MAAPSDKLTPQQQRAQYKVLAGIADLRAGARKAARSKFEEALDIDHESVEARLWLAHVLLEDGESDAAVRQYRTGLLFNPHDQRLSDGLRVAQLAKVHAASPEAQDRVVAKQRLVPNLIMAALMPPAGFILGAWEILTSRTKEWRDLGVKTLLASVAAGVAWIIFLTFVGIVVQEGTP